MNLADLDVCDDIAALRQTAKSSLLERDAIRATITRHEQELHYRQVKIDALLLELARLKRWRFGAQSEQLTAQQRQLFEEALAEDIQTLEQALEAEHRAPPALEPRAPAPKRQVLPAHLPRIEHRYERADCQCEVCQQPLTVIGEDVSEQLDCKPIQFFVHRHIRPKYACRQCQTVTAEPLPAQVIDKGMAAPGLLAQVLISKYQDHQPLYRQETLYQRSGIALTRSTLAGWVGACGVALQPLVDALRTHLLTHAVLHADETLVAVLSPGAGRTHRAYLWAYRSGPTEAAPAVVFDFRMSRAGTHAQQFLAGYSGALMVDDYAGYKALFAAGAVTELACLAHVRRKFFELHAANKSLVAAEALAAIARLYQIERQATGLSAPDRQALRMTEAKPVLDAWRVWLIETRLKVPDSSGTAKAIDYALRRWPALLRYLDDGTYPIDNNPVENAIRPVALGRKNWLFAGTEAAGRRAAAILSLIESAKLNGHDPFAYLRDVLARLPTQPYRRLDELLPFNWMPSADLYTL
jgi:transposase